ncbi:Short-chain dehydrogenase/reductase SDR [Apiospora rasikravindrae]|uniref:Short-chain dehydrogenase/reductase SDR n=1 Tax=Apiospora rasikravindrae TaxID=990691 RepID=A0ABR1RYA6_9PEZI
MVKLREAYPFGEIRRQAKAQLAQPTASFHDKTVVIIGVMCSEAAKVLAQLDVGTLVFGVRNVAKAEMLVDEIVTECGFARERILVKQVDLVSFESTKAFAADLSQSLPRLDVLLVGSATNNTKRFVTGDGWEENLQVIHLSCALLSILLLPKLQDSAKQRHSPAVISNVSSSSVRMTAPMMKFPKVNQPKPPAPAGYLRDMSDGKVTWKLAQYGACKIAHYCWTEALSSLLDPGQVHVHSLDPGCTRSPLSTSSLVARAYLKAFGRSPLICGRAIAHSCLPVENSHGAMLWDYEVEKPTRFMTSAKARDMRKIIWDETRTVLEALSPDAVQIYADLDQKIAGMSSDRIIDCVKE